MFILCKRTPCDKPIKDDLLLTGTQDWDYHKIPAQLPLLSLAYPRTVRCAGLWRMCAYYAEVILLNMPINPSCRGMGNGQVLKSATTLDCVQREEELLLPAPLADPL